MEPNSCDGNFYNLIANESLMRISINFKINHIIVDDNITTIYPLYRFICIRVEILKLSKRYFTNIQKKFDRNFNRDLPTFNLTSNKILLKFQSRLRDATNSFRMFDELPWVELQLGKFGSPRPRKFSKNWKWNFMNLYKNRTPFFLVSNRDKT